MTKALKELEKYILKNYGKRCKSYSALCVVCILWRAFETLENIMDDDIAYSAKSRARKKK